MINVNSSTVHSSKEKRSLKIVSEKSSFGYIESYKALRTNLNYVLHKDGEGKVIMVTSSIPSEGKSNISVNLAITLAQEHKKVIILDCDLRKGTLHRYLRISPNLPGLTSILRGKATPDEAIIYFDKLNISVLISSEIPDNPSELLSSDKMRNLLNVLAQKFDYVILDTPPINAVTDTSIVSKYVDGAIFVVSHNQVTREVALAAKAKLEATKTPILGVVFSKFDPKKSGSNYKKDFAYYNYSYNKYGYGYGEKEKKKK